MDHFCKGNNLLSLVYLSNLRGMWLIMGVLRTAELLLGEDRERPLINRLTFILSFFMLTTGYVFYYSFYGCPFELKSLKLEHKVEKEVKEKTFYENLLTIIYDEGQTENIEEENKKWSEHVSDWWNEFSGDGTNTTDIVDSEASFEEIPYNNSIKVLFKSILFQGRKENISFNCKERTETLQDSRWWTCLLLFT